MKKITILILAAVVCLAAISVGRAEPAPVTITYISSEGVYIDAGTNAGLAIGDTLTVTRATGKVRVAALVITSIAGNSAACRVIEEGQALQVGDFIVMPQQEVANEVPPDTVVETPPEPVARPTRRSTVNRVRGDITIQNFLHHDLTGSGRSWTQPGLRTRLVVENLGGSGSTFQMRHTSRLYHRSSAVYTGQSTNEWTHQVYELSLIHEVDDAAAEWGIGRIIVPYVRGVGYVDGGYLAYQFHPNYRVGVAGGVAPDYQTSAVELGRRKLGAFIAYESGSYLEKRLTLSAALSTEYDHATVSRDFLYLQGTFTRYRRLSVYQSVEIDLNRSWRYAAEGERFTFTNYYGNATVYLSENASVFASYDSRKNIRYFENRLTPDSLFDDATRQGVRGGLRVRLLKRVTMRLHGGVRFREGAAADARSGGASLLISRFPARRHSLMLQLSIVETQFTTGYRPVVTYRFPLAPRLLMNLTGAGYIYKTGSSSIGNYYGDLGASYSFGRRYYLSGRYRQYFNSQLESVELFTEFGIQLR